MLRRVCSCASGLVLLAAALLGVAPTAGAAPGDGPARTSGCDGQPVDEPVRVLVTTLLPQAPRSPDEQLRVAGTLTNCGDRTVDALAVRLSVGDRISRRSGLALADGQRSTPSRRLPSTDADRTALAPGATTTFATTIDVAALRLGSRNGVFPLVVEARGRLPGARTSSAGRAATFLPWFPDGPIAPTRVAWLLPLVDQPRRGPGEVLLDDELERLVGAGPGTAGRLQRALQSGVTGARQGNVPVTYAVDPDLLFTLSAMTRPYTVREAGRRVRRPASQAAARWLTTLREQVQPPAPGSAPTPSPGASATSAAPPPVSARPTADVLALPYADPDVTALARPGTGLRDDIELLSDLGDAETRTALGVAPLPRVAFPPPGPVGPAVDALAGDPLQPSALVLDAGALAASDPNRSRTPSARTTLSGAVAGPVTGLVVEPALSALVEADPTAPDWQGPLLAEQRFLAEIAVLTAERPSESRTIVVAPRRRADLFPAVVAGAMSATGTLPWLCAVPLSDVAAGRERCPNQAGRRPDTQKPAAPEDRGRVLSRPAGQGIATPLPASYVASVARVRRPSDQFTDEVLLAGSPESATTKARLLRARGRTESAAWRDDLSGGVRLLGLLRADVTALRGQIVLRGAPVLLTGRSGIVRVSVENALRQPVNIGVRLEQPAAARLVSDDTAVAEVPGESARQIDIRVTARTSGRFVAQAVLVGRDGEAFGDPEQLQVTSSSYGSVALGVTGLAAGVLFVTVGVRLVRRVLRRGRAA